jgi:N-acetylneuraminate lyase
MGDIYQEMLKAHHAGEIKKVVDLEGEADAIYKIILKHNGVTAGKEIMRFLGIDCGPVRKPLKAFSASDRDTLRASLNNTTFFQHNKAGMTFAKHEVR